MNMVFLLDTINSPILFFLEFGIILGSLGVVFLGKIIYSALFLGVVFLCVALLYLLLNADFLAAAQVLIYVGAINVLIVFAVMLINKPGYETINKKWTLGDVLAGSSASGLFFFLINIIINTSWIQMSPINEEFAKVEQVSLKSIDIIGIHLLTDLLLPFELLSILLLMALAGAITIARKEISTVSDPNQTGFDVTQSD